MSIPRDNVGFTVGNMSDSFQVSRLTIPEAAAGEILVDVLYSGVNPADIKHTTELGIRNTVLGYDFCGRVVDSKSSQFREGDVVAGFTPTGLGRPMKYGSHQSYLICPESLAFLVPPQLPQPDAACVAVVAMTAADALGNVLGIALPPQANQSERSDQPLLIWGASSGVGVCAVQLAKAAGLREIVAVASSKNHQVLREMGATACFDYKDADVVHKIQAYAQNLPQGGFSMALDAAGVVGPKSSAIQMAACCLPDATLVAVIAQPNTKFRPTFALKLYDVRFHLPHLDREVAIPAAPEQHRRSWEVLQWAIKNNGSSFRLPWVEVIPGISDETLRLLEDVAYGRRKASGKIVLKH